MGRCILNSLAAFTAVLVLLAFVPGIPPHGPYTVLPLEKTRPAAGGPVITNDVLDGSQRLFEGQVIGPEGLASRKNEELFFSVIGGHIMKLHGKSMDKLEKVVTIGEQCDSTDMLKNESKCGRPLGIRFGPDGKLLVADAYLGIFKVDVDSGEKKRLFDHTIKVDGAVAKFINDAAEDSEGNIYWSVSSTIADLSRSIFETFAGPSGRLLKYDPRTGLNSVLIDQLMFSNGVQLSPNEDFILVAETFMNRILRYWLKGPKAGTQDVFASGLPGSPDNIRAGPDGGYDVPLFMVKDPDATDITAVLNRLPWLRRILARTLYGITGALDTVTELYDNDLTAKLARAMLNMQGSMDVMAGNRSMVVQLDDSGNIVSNIAGKSGTVMYLSEVEYVGDHIYIGSCCTNYLAKISKSEVNKRRNSKLKKEPQPSAGKQEL